VLITGGGQGIGFGLAARLHARGDKVLVTGRSPDRLDQAAQALPGIETLVNDLTRPAERERLAAHVAAALPGLDLVVNNAGIQRRVSLAADHGGDGVRDQRQHGEYHGGPDEGAVRVSGDARVFPETRRARWTPAGIDLEQTPSRSRSTDIRGLQTMGLRRRATGRRSGWPAGHWRRCGGPTPGCKRCPVPG
jgi:short chain dehydrogenase